MNKLKAMQIFVAVAEKGSFSAGAKHLNIGQASVSKYISALEDDLHCQLIQRNTRQFALTQAGKDYYDYAQRWLNDLEHFEGGLDSRLSQPRGVVKVTAPDHFVSRVIVPLLADFYRAYPDIHLDMQLGEVHHNLVKEGFDFAIRAKTQFEDSNLISQHLCFLPLYLVASPDYLANHPDIDTPQQLSEHNCLVYSNSKSRNQLTFSQNDQKINITVNSNFACNKGEVLLASCIEGLGITALPQWLVEKSLHSGEVIHILSDYDLPTIELKIIYPRRDNLPKRVRLLIDFLKARIQST